MKLHLIIDIIICLALFSSCDKNDGKDPSKLDKPVLEFSANGGTDIATLTENQSFWKVNKLTETTENEDSHNIPCEPDKNGTIKGDWYSIEHTDNPNEILVTLKPNTGEARKIAILITAGITKINLLVTQIAGDPKDFSPQWDSFIDNSTENSDIFIGTKYIGVQNWPLAANPPYIYIGATFPKESFADTFDKEVRGNKHPIDLTFSLPVPYTTSMKNVSGIEYMQKLKEVMKSEEYKSYTPSTKPYIAKLANIKSFPNLEGCFPDNKRFGKLVEIIAKQKLEMKGIKSLSVGKVIFQGFTASMDTPSNGIFMDIPENFNELIYIRTLTYGVTAYFVIASEYPYQDVLKALKSYDYQKTKETISKSQIILLTVSDISQEAILKSSFDDLNKFLANPFQNKYTYGYPVFCKGFYVKDNEVLIEDN